MEVRDFRGTILVVDDEPVVRSVAHAALSRAGYEVIVCEGGAQAIEELRGNPRIALALLDMSMPRMSGREVLQAFYEIRSGLPVVVCSGFSEDEIYRQFEGLRMAGALQKPFTAARLLAAVQHGLDSTLNTAPDA